MHEITRTGGQTYTHTHTFEMQGGRDLSCKSLCERSFWELTHWALWVKNSPCSTHSLPLSLYRLLFLHCFTISTDSYSSSFLSLHLLHIPFSATFSLQNVLKPPHMFPTYFIFHGFSLFLIWWTSLKSIQLALLSHFVILSTSIYMDGSV